METDKLCLCVSGSVCVLHVLPKTSYEVGLPLMSLYVEPYFLFVLCVCLYVSVTMCLAVYYNHIRREVPFASPIIQFF